jgi:hypothetical protein
MSLQLYGVPGLAFGLALVFFYIDFTHKGPKLQRSFLAGVSMSYFFLVVLPEISVNLPEIPHHLENFRFLFILLGFIFVHFAEKLIFKTAEQEHFRRAKELDEKEFNLRLVENSITDFLTSGISQDELDLDAVKELNNIVLSLNQNHKEIQSQIDAIRQDIAQKVSVRVEKLDEMMKFIYHFLVGAILMGLLQYDLLAGLLFFVFAFFMAVLSNKTEDEPKNPEKNNHNHSRWLHILLAASVLLGVIWELIIDSFYHETLNFLYVGFSFTSGVILYNIMLRVIPKNDHDRPLYFLLGFIGFALFILSINLFAHRFI